MEAYQFAASRDIQRDVLEFYHSVTLYPSLNYEMIGGHFLTLAVHASIVLRFRILTHLYFMQQE